MKTVLVVDDNPSVLRLINTALSELDLNVRLAGGGGEALDIYRSEPVHFVLLDMHMPEMDGPETLAALKAIDPKVFCCIMSASVDPSCLTGAAGFLQKPFSLEELRELIEVAVLTSLKDHANPSDASWKIIPMKIGPSGKRIPCRATASVT